MKRDFVCILRILVDLLPKSLRNSKLLFNFARIFFGIPKSLFAFREKYDSGNIKNLSIYYFKNSDYSLKRIAKETDVNSFHLRYFLQKDFDQCDLQFYQLLKRGYQFL